MSFLQSLEETSNHCIERDRYDHDGYADKGRPPKKVVERDECQRDLTPGGQKRKIKIVPGISLEADQKMQLDHNCKDLAAW